MLAYVWQRTVVKDFEVRLYVFREPLSQVLKLYGPQMFLKIDHRLMRCIEIETRPYILGRGLNHVMFHCHVVALTRGVSQWRDRRRLGRGGKMLTQGTRASILFPLLNYTAVTFPPLSPLPALSPSAPSAIQCKSFLESCFSLWSYSNRLLNLPVG